MVLNCCELWSRLVLNLTKLNDQFRVNYKCFASHITHTLNSRKVENNTLILKYLLHPYPSIYSGLFVLEQTIILRSSDLC